MKLRHATPSRNLASILQRGLLCRKSKGRLPVVWLHAPGKTSWALLHTVKRHGGRVEDVIVLWLGGCCPGHRSDRSTCVALHSL